MPPASKVFVQLRGDLGVAARAADSSAPGAVTDNDPASSEATVLRQHSIKRFPPAVAVAPTMEQTYQTTQRADPPRQKAHHNSRQQQQHQQHQQQEQQQQYEQLQQRQEQHQEPQQQQELHQQEHHRGSCPVQAEQRRQEDCAEWTRTPWVVLRDMRDPRERGGDHQDGSSRKGFHEIEYQHVCLVEKLFMRVADRWSPLDISSGVTGVGGAPATCAGLHSKLFSPCSSEESSTARAQTISLASVFSWMERSSLVVPVVGDRARATPAGEALSVDASKEASETSSTTATAQRHQVNCIATDIGKAFLVLATTDGVSTTPSMTAVAEWTGAAYVVAYNGQQGSSPCYCPTRHSCGPATSIQLQDSAYRKSRTLMKKDISQDDIESDAACCLCRELVDAGKCPSDSCTSRRSSADTTYNSMPNVATAAAGAGTSCGSNHSNTELGPNVYNEEAYACHYCYCGSVSVSRSICAGPFAGSTHKSGKMSVQDATSETHTDGRDIMWLPQTDLSNTPPLSLLKRHGAEVCRTLQQQKPGASTDSVLGSDILQNRQRPQQFVFQIYEETNKHLAAVEKRLTTSFGSCRKGATVTTRVMVLAALLVLLLWDPSTTAQRPPADGYSATAKESVKDIRTTMNAVATFWKWMGTLLGKTPYIVETGNAGTHAARGSLCAPRTTNKCKEMMIFSKSNVSVWQQQQQQTQEPLRTMTLPHRHSEVREDSSEQYIVPAGCRECSAAHVVVSEPESPSSPYVEEVMPGQPGESRQRQRLYRKNSSGHREGWRCCSEGACTTRSRSCTRSSNIVCGRQRNESYSSSPAKESIVVGTRRALTGKSGLLLFASAEPIAPTVTSSEHKTPPAEDTPNAADFDDDIWEDTFVTAMMLVEKEDNREAAFPLFVDCALSDDVRCQYELGVHYFLGLPPLPERNFTAAMVLWHVSAWGGSAEAQYALSLMHANLRELPLLPAFPTPAKTSARVATKAKAASSCPEPGVATAAVSAAQTASKAAKGENNTCKLRSSSSKNETQRLWPLVQVRASDYAVVLYDREGSTDWTPLTTFTEQLQRQAYEERQQNWFSGWVRKSFLSHTFGRLVETFSGWWRLVYGSNSTTGVASITDTDGDITSEETKKKKQEPQHEKHWKKAVKPQKIKEGIVMNYTMQAAIEQGLASPPFSYSGTPSSTAGSSSSSKTFQKQQMERTSSKSAARVARRKRTRKRSSTAVRRVSSTPNFAVNSGIPMVWLYAAAAAGHPGAMMAMAQRLQSSSLDAPLKQQQACTGATNFLLPLARQVATSYASGIPQAPELLRFHSPMMSVNSKGQQRSSDALLLFVPQAAAAATGTSEWGFSTRSTRGLGEGGSSRGGGASVDTVQNSSFADRLSVSSGNLDMLTAVAQEGNTALQLALGKRYLFGVEGLPQDFQLAQEFLLAAAESGRSEARALLGYMHALGVGVPRNTTSATLWFLSAVEAADHPVAYSGLGYLHFFGTDLIERNEEVALHFFNISATHGFPDAQTNLASMYISGHGHPQSFVQAMQWYTRALQSGSTGAAYALGLMHLNGLGAVRDCGLASSLLKRLAERSGYVTIKLQRVYDLYAQGRYDEAAFFLLLLAEAGLEVAQSDLGYLFDSGLTDLFFDGTIEKQRVHAQRFYEMATNQGSPLGGLRLGDFAYHGYGMQRRVVPSPQRGRRRYVDDEGNDMTEWIKEAIPVYSPRKEVNYSAAVAHYRRVAEMSATHKSMAAYAARGSFNLGFMHMYGLGVKQDFSLARQHFLKCLETDPSSPTAPVYVALGVLILLRYKHEADIQGVLKELYADVRVSILIVLLLLLVVLLVMRRIAVLLLHQNFFDTYAPEQLHIIHAQAQRQEEQEQSQDRQTAREGHLQQGRAQVLEPSPGPQVEQQNSGQGQLQQDPAQILESSKQPQMERQNAEHDQIQQDPAQVSKSSEPAPNVKQNTGQGQLQRNPAQASELIQQPQVEPQSTGQDLQEPPQEGEGENQQQ